VVGEVGGHFEVLFAAGGYASEGQAMRAAEAIRESLTANFQSPTAERDPKPESGSEAELRRLRVVYRAALAFYRAFELGHDVWENTALRTALGDALMAVAAVSPIHPGPQHRQGEDPMTAALALATESVGYRELRNRLAKAVIGVFRQEERLWTELAATGGLDAGTWEAAVDMRNSGWCALIAAIGGEL
jgi:hypothetical protein